MLGLRIVIYMAIFLTSSAIGILKSTKYTDRVNELKEFKSGLNIFKTKVKFTYEPIPEIFNQISISLNSKIGKIFQIASNNMKDVTAGEAWNMALDIDILNINEEDKNVLKSLSKLLGKTDVNGQISQIELTSTFIDEQIAKAEKERQQSEKMYRSLGMIIGIGIVIILI